MPPFLTVYREYNIYLNPSDLTVRILFFNNKLVHFYHQQANPLSSHRELADVDDIADYVATIFKGTRFG